MANEQEIVGYVQSSVATVLNVNKDKITPASTIIKDLGAESIDLLDISCELEKHIGVELDFREVMKHVEKNKRSEVSDLTIQDVVDFVKTLKN